MRKRFIWAEYRWVVLLAGILLSMVLLGCQPPTVPPTGERSVSPTATSPGPASERDTPPAEMVEVKERHEDELLDIPGVVGVAIGRSETTGELVIQVLVNRMTDELREELPEDLEGFPVEAVVAGEIGTQQDESS